MPATTLVGPIVTNRRIIIPNLDALDVERIATRWRWDGGDTRSPRIIMIGIPRIPKPDHQFHWGLRILIGRPNAIRCFQCTNNGAIIFPNHLVRRPVKSVGMKLCHRGRNFRGNRMIVKPGDAFSKPPCLYLVIKTTSKLPVQLVKVIGQCHHVANDSWSWCRLNDELHATK